jgi:hypothetical protein
MSLVALFVCKMKTVRYQLPLRFQRLRPRNFRDERSRAVHLCEEGVGNTKTIRQNQEINHVMYSRMN